MGAISIIAKEMKVMISSNTHTWCFSWSGIEQVQLRVSSFSSEPAPNLVSPSVSFSGGCNYNTLCWLIPTSYKDVLFGVREEGGCVFVLAPSLHKVLFSFGLKWERSHVVWWWQLGGEGGDSAGLCVEQCRAALGSSTIGLPLSHVWAASSEQNQPVRQPWQVGRRGRKLPVVGPGQVVSVALGTPWASSGTQDCVASC